MNPAKTQLTLIGMLILFAYTLSSAEPENESSDTTKIVIIRSANTLYLYNGDSIVKHYKIAVGKKATPTPVGSFKIVTKVVNPGWFPKGKESVAGGISANPVGSRWMGLSEKGYGIHGTNKPSVSVVGNLWFIVCLLKIIPRLSCPDRSEKPQNPPCPGFSTMTPGGLHHYFSTKGIAMI